jgi:hypothetical protein
MVPWIAELAHITHPSMRRLGRILPNLDAQILSLASVINLDLVADEDTAENDFEVIKVESRPAKRRGAGAKTSADHFPYLATHPVSPTLALPVAKRAKRFSSAIGVMKTTAIVPSKMFTSTPLASSVVVRRRVVTGRLP